ncbi:MAG TPA: hypothetical protein VGB24_05940 [Longimicrobium sp.]|jgi:hypothetical protein|uniref:hypothetical protein n=1 Tax=Longimicrobium sp. TaxID=2029185 RepID=UPI002ED8A88E
MSTETYYQLVLIVGWSVLGVMGAIGLWTVFLVMREDRARARDATVRQERRIGAPDRRAHAETR